MFRKKGMGEYVYFDSSANRGVNCNSNYISRQKRIECVCQSFLIIILVKCKMAVYSFSVGVDIIFDMLIQWLLKLAVLFCLIGQYESI